MANQELFTGSHLAWLAADGTDSDVVLASRVCLSRNLHEVPFPNRADLGRLAETEGSIAAVLGDVEEALEEPFDRVELAKSTALEQNVLWEKHLVSRQLLKNPAHRSAYISNDRSMSILVNGENHLRIQAMAAGFDLKAPYDRASRVDDVFEAKLDFAFDEKLGYLTSCPTDLGTGLRASVMLHLPGLVYTENIGNILNISPQIGLSMSAMYGEGAESAGNLFAVANKLSLGLTERELCDNLRISVGEIVEQERRARKALLLYEKDRIEDEVWRAYGVLHYARALGDAETLAILSRVRLGVDLGFIEGLASSVFGDILIASRANYLCSLAGNENMSKNEIDRKRAEVVRRILETAA